MLFLQFSRGVCKTLSNIYDGAILRKGLTKGCYLFKKSSVIDVRMGLKYACVFAFVFMKC